MLIVRLYDGDVNERERIEANSLVAGCGECAQLFADLGAIRAATQALPTPPRPRDFFLTEADAIRLGRPDGTPVRGPGRWAWSNVRRSFGGALAALGLVGVLVTGASTFLTASQSARLMSMDTNGSHSVPDAAQPKPATGVAMPTAAPAQLGPAAADQTPGTESASFPLATSRSNTTSNGTPPAVPAASPLDLASTAPATAAASPANQQQGGTKTAATPPGAVAADGGQVVAAPSNGYAYTNGSGTSGGSTATATAASRTGGGPDLAALAFAGFGLALALGLALLVGPRIIRLAGRTR